MRFLLPFALILPGCDDRARSDADPSAPTNMTNILPPADNRVSRPAALIPLPKDQAETDRLILAGYTPHSDHLHAPGVKTCPLAQGGEAVM